MADKPIRTKISGPEAMALLNRGKSWLRTVEAAPDAFPGNPEMSELFRNQLANRTLFGPGGSMLRTQRGPINFAEAYVPAPKAPTDAATADVQEVFYLALGPFSADGETAWLVSKLSDLETWELVIRAADNTALDARLESHGSRLLKPGKFSDFKDGVLREVIPDQMQKYPLVAEFDPVVQNLELGIEYTEGTSNPFQVWNGLSGAFSNFEWTTIFGLGKMSAYEFGGMPYYTQGQPGGYQREFGDPVFYNRRCIDLLPLPSLVVQDSPGLVQPPTTQVIAGTISGFDTISVRNASRIAAAAIGYVKEIPTRSLDYTCELKFPVFYFERYHLDTIIRGGYSGKLLVASSNYGHFEVGKFGFLYTANDYSAIAYHAENSLETANADYLECGDTSVWPAPARFGSFTAASVSIPAGVTAPPAGPQMFGNRSLGERSATLLSPGTLPVLEMKAVLNGDEFVVNDAPISAAAIQRSCYYYQEKHLLIYTAFMQDASGVVSGVIGTITAAGVHKKKVIASTAADLSSASVEIEGHAVNLNFKLVKKVKEE